MFHAYAWLKLYNLEDKSSDDSGNELNSMASCLVLAALAVPIFSRGDGVSEYSGIEAHKMKEMAALLGYHFSPKRSSLMEQLVSMNLLELCHPEIQKLFGAPLSIQFYINSSLFNRSPIHDPMGFKLGYATFSHNSGTLLSRIEL